MHATLVPLPIFIDLQGPSFLLDVDCRSLDRSFVNGKHHLLCHRDLEIPIIKSARKRRTSIPIYLQEDGACH